MQRLPSPFRSLWSGTSQPRRRARAILSGLLLLGAGACGTASVRGLMIQINRLYLEVRDHLDAEDFPALAEDGARLAALAESIRPFNAAADFQQHAAELGEVARALEAAGRQEDLEAVREAYRALNRPCAECHRVYKDPRR